MRMQHACTAEKLVNPDHVRRGVRALPTRSMPAQLPKLDTDSLVSSTNVCRSATHQHRAHKLQQRLPRRYAARRPAL